MTTNSTNTRYLDSALFRISRTIPGHLPDFLIIGAQKSGTTGIFNSLKEHPKLRGSARKEIHFFNNDTVFRNGLTWYKRYFWDYSRYLKKYPLYFEATPDYLYYDKSAERISTICKDVKVLILLRDPVKRAYSAWNMFRGWREQGKTPSSFYNDYIRGQKHNLLTELFLGADYPDFEACIESELVKIRENSCFLEPSFLRRGIYLPQIQRYHEALGEENVLIIEFGELKRDQIGVLNRILMFLGLPTSDWCFLDNDVFKNSRKYHEEINPDTKVRLEQFFEPHNQRLFEYLDHELEW